MSRDDKAMLLSVFTQFNITIYHAAQVKHKAAKLQQLELILCEAGIGLNPCKECSCICV